MSKVGEASEAIRTLENIVSGYMGYDSVVGGIVSQGCQLLAEARELLKKPTKKNIQEAKKRVQTFNDNASPYAPQAPDAFNQMTVVMEKLREL